MDKRLLCRRQQANDLKEQEVGMRKRGELFFKYLFAFCIAVVLCFSDNGFVMAREGLSDAELYGNGQESILYQGTSHTKSYRDNSQGKKTEYSNQQSDGKDKEKSSENAGENTTAASDIVQDAGRMEETASVEPEQEDASANAVEADMQEDGLEGVSMQEESITSADAVLKEEDIVITGVESGGVYNKAVTIEISAVQPDAVYPLRAQLYKAEEAGEQQDEMRHFEGDELGLQIGLSSVGQLVSGSTRVSEEGSYELKLWQDADRQQESPEEIKPIRQLSFMLDMTAPVIDRERIRRLCESRIDIEEICKKAVRDESKVTTNCFVNEQQFSKGIIQRPGEYELVIKAEDEAGNQVQEQVQITLKDRQDMTKKQGRYSRFMAPSVIVLLFGVSLFMRERKKEKQEVEYEQRDK